MSNPVYVDATIINMRSMERHLYVACTDDVPY
jgi:hypothetical protein